MSEDGFRHLGQVDLYPESVADETSLSRRITPRVALLAVIAEILVITFAVGGFKGWWW